MTVFMIQYKGLRADVDRLEGKAPGVSVEVPVKGTAKA
jgi:hypothetical protein